MKKKLSKTNKELVSKESKALEEALDNDRKAEYRFERPRKKLAEKWQALELMLKEQKGVSARICRTLNETTESPRCHSCRHMTQPRRRCGPLPTKIFTNTTNAQRRAIHKLAELERHATESGASSPSAASKPNVAAYGSELAFMGTIQRVLEQNIGLQDVLV